MKLLLKGMFSLALILLAGCNTAFFNPDSSFSKEKLKPNEGIICGTFYNFNPRFKEISAWRMASYQCCALNYRKINEKEDGRIHQLGMLKSVYSVTNEAVRGRAFVKPLEAGEYEFYSYNLSMGNGLATYRFLPQSDFSIRFTVKPGEIVYLGQIACTNDYSTDQGFFWLDGAHWEFSDNSSNDMAKLASLYPNIDWSQCTIAPIQAEGIPNFSVLSTSSNYIPMLTAPY